MSSPKKAGGSHGSYYPTVKFLNAYDEVILDANDTETLNSFPESYDIEFLTSYTSDTSLRTTNVQVVIEALKTSLKELKGGDSKKAS